MMTRGTPMTQETFIYLFWLWLNMRVEPQIFSASAFCSAIAELEARDSLQAGFTLLASEPRQRTKTACVFAPKCCRSFGGCCRRFCHIVVAILVVTGINVSVSKWKPCDHTSCDPYVALWDEFQISTFEFGASKWLVLREWGNDS